jgi:ubiquinone/menaquinone biosynthesis C-methylase UbiE
MKTSSDTLKEVLNGQRLHWEKTIASNPEMFGEAPSEPARKAAELFKKEKRNNILELGGGQGRDTIYFATNDFHITVLDYSKEAIETITEKAHQLRLSQSIITLRHDVRTPLPFADESFDACYSHMLFCMALTTVELQLLAWEVRRVLKQRGLNIYTVRHTGDPHYGTGIHRGEDMYEVGGFVVHFFSTKKVEHLAKGYDVVNVTEFEDGELPRKLFRVTLRKKDG